MFDIVLLVLCKYKTKYANEEYANEKNEEKKDIAVTLASLANACVTEPIFYFFFPL